MAQEGTSKKPGSKWQMVVPKLVPVNLARVQDAPAVVSHVTAYNTKIDKVMDVLLYHPGESAGVDLTHIVGDGPLHFVDRQTLNANRDSGRSGSRRRAVTAAWEGFVSNTEEYAKRLYHRRGLSGIEVRRGSDCFVYWSDPQKGLTWGLNFVCAEEANYFVDLVVSISLWLILVRVGSAPPR